MKVEICEELPPRWDGYVYAHSAGTFFHEWKWRQIISKSFGFVPLYLTLEDNGQCHGVLPLFLVRSLLFGRSLVSLPMAVYGGLLASDDEAAALLLDKAKELGIQHRAKYLELRGNPYQPVIGAGLPHQSDSKRQKDLYVTFIGEIDIVDDVNLSRIPRKQRRMVRQGEKHGLRFVQDNSRLLDFYNIYAASVRNLGTPVYGFRYFERIVQGFGDRCKIFLVDYEGKAIAGVLVFFYKDQVLPYYGGALKEYSRFASSDFMYWELMRYGAAHGYKIFDFGRSKQGTGSFDFKRHWGFEPRPLPYSYYLIKSQFVPDTSSLNPRLQWAVRIWRNLPLKLTMALGPRIMRHIP